MLSVLFIFTLYIYQDKVISASYASTFPISIIIQTQLHRTPRPPNSTIFYRRHDVHRSNDVVWFLATTTAVSNRCQCLQLGPTLFVHVVGVCVMRHFFPAFCAYKTRSELWSVANTCVVLSWNRGLLAPSLTKAKRSFRDITNLWEAIVVFLVFKIHFSG